MSRSLTLLLVLFSIHLEAQVFITGTVTNAAMSPIPFATVKWKKDSLAPASFFALTDTAGFFRLQLSGAGKGQIEISAVGYKSASFPVNTSDSAIKLEVILQTTGQLLERVVIQAKPSIKISGDTVSYQTEQFRRGNESSLADLLRNLPGFTVTKSGRVVFNGKLIERVLLEGDDLSGKDYGFLIGNLDADGIEQLQVIRNFKDPANILSDFTSGNGQALNIRYEKGKLHRVSGSVDLTTGLPLSRNGFGLQALGLFTKAKGLLLQQYNSLGMRRPLSDEDPYFNNAEANTSNEIDVPVRAPLADILEKQLDAAGPEPILRNQTAESLFNSILKPLPNLSLTTRLNYRNDDIAQQANATTRYLTDGLNTVIDLRNTQNAIQKIRDGSFSINYLTQHNSQIVLTLKATTTPVYKNAQDQTSGMQNFNEDLRYTLKQQAVKLVINKLLPGTSALAVTIEAGVERLRSDYFLIPPRFSELFPHMEPGEQIHQNEKHTFKKLQAQVRYLKKWKAGQLQTTLQLLRNRYSLVNSIASAWLNREVKLPADSVNNFDYCPSAYTGTIQYAWRGGQRLKISAATEFSLLAYPFQNNAGAAWQGLNSQLRVFPKATVQYKFEADRQLTLSANVAPRFPEGRMLGGGFAIQDLSTVTSMASDPSPRTFQSLSLTYSDIRLLERHRLLFASLSHTTVPSFFLKDISGYGNYVYSRLVTTGSNLNSLILFVNYQKFSKNFKSKFSPNLSFSAGSNTRLFASMEQVVRFRSARLACNVDTEFGPFQSNASIQYTWLQQTGNHTITNQNVSIKFAMNYKFADRFFGDVGADTYFVKNAQQPVQSFCLLESKFAYKSANKKWDLGLRGTNLTGQLYFTSVFVNPISTSTTLYYIFPRTVCGFLKHYF